MLLFDKNLKKINNSPNVSNIFLSILAKNHIHTCQDKFGNWIVLRQRVTLIEETWKSVEASINK